jgi:hypothetical protein
MGGRSAAEGAGGFGNLGVRSQGVCRVSLRAGC